MKSIAELLGGTKYEQEFKAGEHAVVLQSLTKGEEMEVLRKAQGLDFYAQIEASKIPILARSLVQIDKVPVQTYPEFQAEFKKAKDGKVNIVEVTEKIFEGMDGGLVDYLYSFYLQLKEMREKDRATLLGFTPALKEGQSSNSVNSTENTQKS